MLSFLTMQNYGVSFPMMAKSDVNGSNTNEVFQFLKKQKTGILGTEMISMLSTTSLVGLANSSTDHILLFFQRLQSGTSPSSSSTSRATSSSDTVPTPSLPPLHPPSRSCSPSKTTFLGSSSRLDVSEIYHERFLAEVLLIPSLLHTFAKRTV